MIVVVREGIDGELNVPPVPQLLRDITPDDPVVSFRFRPRRFFRSIGHSRHILCHHGVSLLPIGPGIALLIRLLFFFLILFYY